MTSAQAKAARLEALRLWPYCAVCRLYRSRAADHLIPLAWGGGPLRGICEPCHKLKTAEEAAIGRRFHGRPPADVIERHAKKWSEPIAPTGDNRLGSAFDQGAAR